MATAEDGLHRLGWLRALGVLLAIALTLIGLAGSGQAAIGPTGGPIPRELNGTWSVLAGDRTAPGNFQNPTGLGVDAAGNVYVDDTQNFRIEKLSPSGQFLTAFGDAGNLDGQLQFADGLALDRAGNVYVADTQNHRIQKFSPRGFPVAVWGQHGSAPGEFRAPTDVAVDRSGNIYVTDRVNHRLEKLSPEGKALAIWGSARPVRGGLVLLWPAGVAVTPAGTVYVSDRSLNRIVKLSPRGKVLAIWGGKGGSGQEFVHPQHLALDRVGHLFVADAGHHRVVELSAGGNELRAWKLGAKANPNGVAVSPAGTLLVTDTRSSRVLQYSLTRPKLLSAWGRDERAWGEFFFPTALAFGPAGTLDVADEGNARIEQVPTSAAVPVTPSVIWSLPRITAKRIAQPVSVATDPAGDLYVVDGRKRGVAKLLPNGRPVPSWPANAKALPADPIGVAVDPGGDVYIADGATSQIWRLDSAGHLLSRWGHGRGKGPGQFRFDRSGPAGIASDLQGHIYVTDTNNSRIEKFTSTGRLLATWHQFDGFPGSFSYPYGVATDTHGNVYVADSYNDAIEELSPTGSLIAEWGSQGYAPAQFRLPTGIAVDGSGRIYVADSNNDRIQVYTPLEDTTPASLVRVSSPAAIVACTVPPSRRNELRYAAETRLAVNPATTGTGHVNLVGAWFQGIGLEVVTASSTDDGATWQDTSLPFSRCVPGGLPFEGSGDPWVSIGPDGTAYLVALGDTFKKVGKHYHIVADGIELATSGDGGRTWTNIRTAARESSAKPLKTVVDKPTVAADPVHAGTAYVFWDSLNQKTGFTGWMIKTTDGGRTWSSPLAFLPAHRYRSVAALHQPVIDPRTGTIYDVFSYARIYRKYIWSCRKVRGKVVCGSGKYLDEIRYLALVRSTDGGATWSAPRIIARRAQVGIPDYVYGAWIRTGVGIDAALNPADGSLHVVWCDGTYSEGGVDQVLTSSSADGGATWTSPVRVTQLPAFNPSITINSDGTIAVTYYTVRQMHSLHPFREITKHPSAIVAYMMQTSSDGGATFGAPRPVFGAFNINHVLNDSGQFFVGDYQGLVAVGREFHPFFIAANAGSATEPVDVFTGAMQP